MFDNSRLTDKARDRNVSILWAIYVEGLTPEQAAEQVGCTVANVKTALYGGGLASAEAHMALGLPLPRASRKTALAAIKFGTRMLEAIESYDDGR